MNTKSTARISVLAVVVLVAALLAFRGIQGMSVMAAPNSLEGVWMVTVSPEGGTPFSDVTTFSHDGSVTIMENDGRLGIGVWEKVSDHSYAFTAWEYWKEEGTFFQAKISSPIDLGKGGEKYSGPFSVQIFVVGNPDPVVIAKGSATGVRMHLQ